MGRVSPRGRDKSFKEFLDRQKCDERTRRLMTGFVEGFDAARTERISAQALLAADRAASEMSGDAQGRVNEGYSALVGFYEKEIRSRGGTLVKEALARRMRWKIGRGRNRRASRRRRGNVSGGSGSHHPAARRVESPRSAFRTVVAPEAKSGGRDAIRQRR